MASRNRIIFDMNSLDTFNYDYLEFFYNDPNSKSKPKQFPPWLKAPSHYVGNVWRLTIKSLDGLMYLRTTDNRVLLTLECMHTKYINEMDFKLRGAPRAVYVNCEQCGGTGEIRIL